jgi:hypothetical protein
VKVSKISVVEAAMTTKDPYYWENLLDVVNCSRSMRRISKGVYACPVTGSAYTHRRARYFGAYENKAVSWLFEIKAVVTVGRDLSSSQVNWKNVDIGDESLRQEAIQKIKMDNHLMTEIAKQSLQVFLLENPARTSFYKSTKGGMLGSKQYFPGIAEGCGNSKDLAERLRNKRWSDF